MNLAEPSPSDGIRAVSGRRLMLLKSAAVIAGAASVLGLLVGFLVEPDPTVRRALDLHGAASVIPADVLVQIGWVQLLLAATAYVLVFLDSRYALPSLILTLALSVLTHLFGGLSVSMGFVSLVQFAIYLAEGFMLALLLMRAPTLRVLSEP